MIQEIQINGQTYPWQATMGAYLQFRHETGHDVTDKIYQDPSELCTWLWCCIVSACRRDGVKFDVPLAVFADYVTVEEFRNLLVPHTSGDASESQNNTAKKKGESRA